MLNEKAIGIDAQHIEALHKLTSPPKYKVLLTLAASGKPLAYSQLLMLTSMNPGTMKRHLDDLLELGVVEKTRLGKYRRNSPRSFYRISTKGYEILERSRILTPEQVEKLQRLFREMVKPE
jgi:DNA-binding transcriptional ArsR family regulator